jgi:acyl carrier protein
MTEEKLAACLNAATQVFGKKVNPNEAFYDLGGDSLHAIQLAQQIQDLTGTEINVFDMVNADSLGVFFRSCLVDT